MKRNEEGILRIKYGAYFRDEDAEIPQYDGKRARDSEKDRISKFEHISDKSK